MHLEEPQKKPALPIIPASAGLYFLIREFYNQLEKLNIEPEVHYVAVLHDIVLAFDPQDALVLAGGL